MVVTSNALLSSAQSAIILAKKMAHAEVPEIHESDDEADNDDKEDDKEDSEDDDEEVQGAQAPGRGPLALGEGAA